MTLNFIVGQMSRPRIDHISSNTLVHWSKPESLADPSDFSYSIQVISTTNIIIQNFTTNTTNTTLNNPIADSNNCTEYYIIITPIANGGIGRPIITEYFIFPTGKINQFL